MRLRVVVQMGLVGCREETETEVDDSATEDEIQDAVREAALELVEWTHEVIPETCTACGGPIDENSECRCG